MPLQVATVEMMVASAEDLFPARVLLAPAAGAVSAHDCAVPLPS